MQGMRPKGNQLTKLYKNTVAPFVSLGLDWNWRSGEKKRILRAFIIFCESHNVRDRDQLDEMMRQFSAYIHKRAASWLEWDEATRANYLGFVLKKEDIEVYAAKSLQPDKNSAESKNVAGTKDNQQWDF